MLTLLTPPSRIFAAPPAKPATFTVAKPAASAVASAAPVAPVACIRCGAVNQLLTAQSSGVYV